MDNKLSELSKPVQIFKHPSGRNFWSVSADSNAGQQDVEAFYSQEYVSALLAELDAKDDALRAIAFHVSVGGYNADSVEAEVFKQKIIDGINIISDVLVKRIAELERANTSQDDHINQQQDRIESLEKKNGDLGRALFAAEKRLATPVRLPDVLFIKVSGSAVPVMHAGRVMERVRAAGFTVEGDK
ncbi:hypothetical protein [Serratia marcescens]|uniref:hypothetical protein n=1 Tax=Serratia marcescens TaxID=615 RepID=UPI001867695A|nr:hypothetical protein [Serratia marcescens]